MLFFFIALLVPCDLRPRERAAERLKDDKGLRDFRFPFLLERFRAPLRAEIAYGEQHPFRIGLTV